MTLTQNARMATGRFPSAVVALMLVPFGKHQGKTVGTLVLKHPDYIKWVLAQQGPTGGLKRIRDEAERLIRIFDAKPILGACSGRNCKRPPVIFSAADRSSSLLYQWCDSCDPYQSGAAPGKLTVVRTYRAALNHVESTCGGVKSSYKTIIGVIAQRKGLPKRSGERQVDAFFT